MMSHFLGMDTFKKGLNRYLTTLEYSNAFHDDLWNILSQQAAIDNKDINVKAVMDTWILQMNYPVVTVRRVLGSSNTLSVTQERYLEHRNASELGKYESPFNYTWTIPLTITSNETRIFNQTDHDIYWMYRNETTKLIQVRETLPLDHKSWILANIGEYGYYRVNYDLENWKALTDQLQEDHKVIPVINRAQIINDAWNLAKGGYLSMDVAFSTLDYLDKETDYQPWLAVRRELNQLDNMFAVNSIYGQFQRFLRCKLQNPYSHFGLNNTGASHLEILARGVIAGQACKYGTPSCIRAASEQYEKWMLSNSSENMINTNLRSVVYCNAISDGGYEEWLWAFNRYKKEELATERTTLLSAMACTRHPWILNNYMGLTLINDSGIRFHDSLRVISFVASNPVGQSLAWNFYRSNFNALKTSYSSSFFRWLDLVASITRPMNAAYELEQLKAFKAAQGDNLSDAASAFDQAIEKVTANVQWMDDNQANIARILESKLAQSKC
ncbi:hypothetical protein Btru_039358 [Bulinus truncatus]|nr:hypothetical protein Btru_039358 [Bulinus truncatus]